MFVYTGGISLERNYTQEGMRSWIQRPTRGECAASSWWWMEVGLAIDWFVPLWNQTARHAVAWHNRQTSPLVSWQMLTLARSLAVLLVVGRHRGRAALSLQLLAPACCSRLFFWLFTLLQVLLWRSAAVRTVYEATEQNWYELRFVQSLCNWTGISHQFRLLHFTRRFRKKSALKFSLNLIWRHVHRAREMNYTVFHKKPFFLSFIIHSNDDQFTNFFYHLYIANNSTSKLAPVTRYDVNVTSRLAKNI